MHYYSCITTHLCTTFTARLGAGAAAAAERSTGDTKPGTATSKAKKLDANSQATYDEVDVENLAGHMDLDENEMAKIWEQVRAEAEKKATGGEAATRENFVNLMQKEIKKKISARGGTLRVKKLC